MAKKEDSSVEHGFPEILSAVFYTFIGIELITQFTPIQILVGLPHIYIYQPLTYFVLAVVIEAGLFGVIYRLTLSRNIRSLDLK